MTASMFPQCPLPGCRNLTHRQGHPCSDCVRSFGAYLTHTPAGDPLTATQQADRDTATLAAYTVQHALAVDRTLAIEAGNQAKPGQTCWLCEQRRTCRRVGGRWECAGCQTVT